MKGCIYNLARDEPCPTMRLYTFIVFEGAFRRIICNSVNMMCLYATFADTSDSLGSKQDGDRFRFVLPAEVIFNVSFGCKTEKHLF